MTFEGKNCGKINLSGSLTRKSRSVEDINDYYDYDSHIENIGVLIEDLETSIRNSLEVIYVMKTKEIIDSCRKNQEIQKFGMKQFNLKDMMMKK
jgi:capping protein beta